MSSNCNQGRSASAQNLPVFALRIKIEDNASKVVLMIDSTADNGIRLFTRSRSIPGVRVRHHRPGIFLAFVPLAAA
jgi:hypothetical protein